MSVDSTLCPYPALPSPARVKLTVLPSCPCPYLPDRTETIRALYARDDMDPDMYHAFMDAGFRRSGRIVYQPVCRGCRACVPLRVIVSDHRPSKTDRRVLRRNEDVQLFISKPDATDEKYALYQAYQSQWHGRDLAGDARDDFEQFLYDSPVQSIEFSYRDQAGRLLAVGIADVSSRALSSVYFYFDPLARQRSLGVMGALREIDFCRQQGLPFYYLGYWVEGCRKMAYKAGYQPHELLLSTGEWMRRPATGDATEAIAGHR